MIYDIIIMIVNKGMNVRLFMTVVKFLFVLALAVPLMVFMGYYIVNLQKEFLKNVKEQQAQTQKKRHSNVDEKRVPQSRSLRRKTYDDSEYRMNAQQEERVKNVKPAYDSKRANFDNSAMKRRYEQSVMKQRNAYAKTASESEIHDRDINKSKVRKKSKRQRRKELRNKSKS